MLRDDALGMDLDRVMGEDRAWFAANPMREFRVRRVRLAEVPNGAIIRPDDRVVVRRIVDSVRIRSFVSASDLPPEDSDDALHRWWRRHYRRDPRFNEENIRTLRRAAATVLAEAGAQGKQDR